MIIDHLDAFPRWGENLVSGRRKQRPIGTQAACFQREGPRPRGVCAIEHQARRHRRHRRGRWLPHQDALEEWIEGLAEDVRSRGKAVSFHPVIEEFRGLIEGDPIVCMYLTEMIEQVPHTKEYRQRHLESIDQMLRLINEVIRRAPEYNETGLVGAPLNAVLDWLHGDAGRVRRVPPRADQRDVP
jgi:hypothetical protein